MWEWVDHWGIKRRSEVRGVGCASGEGGVFRDVIVMRTGYWGCYVRGKIIRGC